MANYIAKKVTLDNMRECNGRNCGCYSSAGYHIQYKNSNVDCILFVCEECFNEQFRSKCTLGVFQEAATFSNPRRNQCLLEILRRVAWVINSGLRLIRITFVMAMFYLLATFFVEEQPSVRSEFTAPEINTINWECHELDNCFEQIGNQMERIITHGGNGNG